MSGKAKAAPEAVAAVARANEGLGCASSAMVTDRRVEFMRRALEWVKENQGAWDYMQRIALGKITAESQFGMAELAEAVRRRDFTDSRGRTTRLNNNYVPALARLLVKEHPEARRLMETRTNGYDGLVG